MIGNDKIVTLCGSEGYVLRSVRPEEGEACAEIEQICFPPNEACSPRHMRERVSGAPELFLVAEDETTGEIAGFLNGIATDEEQFRDEFFTDVSLHRESGKNVMLLGLDVLPEQRKKGLARALLEEYAAREKRKGRKRLVLTCLEEKVPMYRHLGLRDLGASASVWGGEAWHEMDLVL